MLPRGSNIVEPLTPNDGDSVQITDPSEFLIFAIFVVESKDNPDLSLTMLLVTFKNSSIDIAVEFSPIPDLTIPLA